jgi:hypothetical protein
LGGINFLDTGVPLPPWRRRSDNALIATMSLSQFAALVDLLRNEKPVFYQQANDGGVILSSGFEPVGEAES